ncbi:MAG: T9SS type A sorting domain-containing protein, partial [Ignavibacteria bacterium]|nr:T9SS type A sorting domain-containing protein [Ignavibacteria bacterium]
FGENPPAFMMNLLQKPHSFIPGETFIDNNSNGTYEDSIDTPLDTAYNFQGPLKGIQMFPGAKNLSMTASNSYISSDPIVGDPNDEFEARNYMLGRGKLGQLIDPCNWFLGEVRGGVDCNLVNPLYWYSGDPETDIGWISVIDTDYRILVHTGPFVLEENKPITIIIGYTIGQGDSPLNSVTVGKEVSAFVQQFYQSNFNDNILPVKEGNNLIVDEFKLFQNYPNPFNPSTRIQYVISSRQIVSLKVYDVLGNEIAAVVNEEKPAGSYEVEFNATSLPSGIYFYKLQAGSFVETKKMILLK